jgi:hypothetical protein
MNDLLACEGRMQEHFEHVARVNSEGWRTAKSGTRPLTTMVARALVALAVRLDATVATRTRAAGGQIRAATR